MLQPLKPILAEDVLNLTAAMHRVFTTVCKKQNLDPNKFIVKTMKLSEAALRTLRRAEFYNQYHKPRMSEVKLGAILAFWVLKYRPFCSRIIKDDYTSEHINEFVAINIMLHNIERSYQEINSTKKLSITFDGYKQLVYRLKNWDLSKEGLMTLADILYNFDGTKIDFLDTSFSTYGRT